jgi:hypothetical protein
MERYVDPYKGLPVVISGPRQRDLSPGPVHFKGYSGIIKNYNPHLQMADVELNATQRTVQVKLEFLRF